MVLCSVKDSDGKPVEDVKIDIWEADSTGTYDVMNPNLEGPDGRCVMNSDKDGLFWFKAIRPVSYPIPDGGTVIKLLELLHRQPWRPAHIHFVMGKPGYDELTT